MGRFFRESWINNGGPKQRSPLSEELRGPLATTKKRGQRVLDERFPTRRGELSSGLALGFTFPTFTTPNPKRGWGQVRVSGRTRHSNTLTSTQGHVNKEITDDKGHRGRARTTAIL